MNTGLIVVRPVVGPANERGTKASLVGNAKRPRRTGDDGNFMVFASCWPDSRVLAKENEGGCLDHHRCVEGRVEYSKGSSDVLVLRVVNS